MCGSDGNPCVVLLVGELGMVMWFRQERGAGSLRELRPKSRFGGHSRVVGSCSEASYLERNSAMDDSIGGS